MALLLLVLLPFLELYTLVKVGSQLGWINTLFALVAIGILGAGLARSQGRYVLARLQASLARGEAPEREIVSGLLVFVGGVFFLIPGFITDVVGLLLVFPLTRYLFVSYVTKKLTTRARSGGFKVFTFGGAGGMGGMAGGFRTHAPHAERPVEQEWNAELPPNVIDVTPISSETKEDKGRED